MSVEYECDESKIKNKKVLLYTGALSIMFVSQSKSKKNKIKFKLPSQSQHFP